MTMPFAMVIVNPVAGAGSTWRKWPRISALLKNLELSFDYKYTDGVGHARSWLRRRLVMVIGMLWR